MNLRRMRETIRAYRAGAPLGDVVVMKLDALAAPPQETLRSSRRCTATRPITIWLRCARCRAGTLGREYARFLDENGIAPLVVSPALKERFRDNP